MSERLCSRCEKPYVRAFYCGVERTRCGCYIDHRTPIEIRRDAVLDKYGRDPEAYTPAILKQLAIDGLLDVSVAFCPAGKLSMEETRKREASQRGDA